jgi:hypothetical protein
MIEKSAASRSAGSGGGLLDLNHTRIIDLAGVLQIAKFVPNSPHTETNFAIRTPARHPSFHPAPDRSILCSELRKAEDVQCKSSWWEAASVGSRSA